MKKKILTALTLTVCAALLVAGSIFGTVAYLTSQVGVTNVFTFGRVAIDMTESLVDANGKAITGTNAARVRTNNYKMVPGKTYDKDPVIEILQNSENLYLFVKVDNQLTTYETKDSGKTIADQLAKNGWVALDANHPGVYVYVVNKATAATTAEYNYIVTYNPSGTNKIPVFEKFTAATDFGNSTSTIKDMSIVITAYAVQADGFNTPVEAFVGAGFGTSSTTTNP